MSQRQNKQKFVYKVKEDNQTETYVKKEESQEKKQQFDNNQQQKQQKPKDQQQQNNSSRYNNEQNKNQQQQQRRQNNNQNQQQNYKPQEQKGEQKQQKYQIKQENKQQDNYKQKTNSNNQNYNNNKQQYQGKTSDQNYQGGRNKNNQRNNDNKQYRNNQNKGRQNRQSNKSQNKKYSEYYNKKQVEKGLEEGTLFEGFFIANDKSNMYAQIKCDKFEKRVFVNSQADINRALHKSEVVFRLKTAEEINEMQKDKQIQKLIKEQRELQKIKNPESKQPKKKVLYILKKEVNEEEEEDDDVHRIAEIVYIKENPWKNVNIVGQINKINIYNQQEVDKQEKIKQIQEEEKQQNLNEEENEEDNEENEEKDEEQIDNNKDNKKNKKNNQKNKNQGPIGFWFYPVDKRLPRMYIKSIQNPKWQDLSEEELQQNYYTGKIIEWSQYTFHPDIHLQEEFGQIGDIEVECQAILKSNDINEQDFEEETIKYLEENIKLDENGQYIITEEERKSRMDLTNEIICTIDPATAKDLDDALSIKKISEEIYEVGVHIADVGHFVTEGSPLEDEAKLRTTSVYLTHRVIPMLPRLLCENLCSLNPNVERLAFSIFFQVNKETGDIDFDNGVRYGKSIIKSCAKMSYETAQKIIQGDFKSVEEVPTELLPNSSVNQQEWFDNIQIMNELAKKRKQLREDKGAFDMSQRQKLSFELDEKLWPVKYTIQERQDAHKMIEEMMVTANCLAAYKVIKTNKQLAVIRRHSFPTLEKQQAFFKKIDHDCQYTDGKRPFELDFGNANALRDSIQDLKNNKNLSENAKTVIQFYLIKLLEAAEYKVTENSNEETWRHFGLQTEVYTHFTSPIRRYPDILAHRLLFKCLQYGEKLSEHVDLQDMKSMLEICNEKKLQAKRVSDGSSKIFICLYLKNHSVKVNAIVTGFSEKSMTIIVPDYDIEKDISFRNVKNIVNTKILEKDNETQKQKQLQLQYAKNMIKDSDFQEKEQDNQQITIENLQNVQVLLTATDKFPIDYKINLILTINNQEYVLN